MKAKARKNYYALVGSYHSFFAIAKIALHISTDYPHQGASPDGVTDCDCSDKGLVEMKCTCKYSTGLNDRKTTNILLSTHQKMLKKIIHILHKCNGKCFCLVLSFMIFLRRRQQKMAVCWSGLREYFILKILPKLDEYFLQSFYLRQCLERVIFPVTISKNIIKFFRGHVLIPW